MFHYRAENCVIQEILSTPRNVGDRLSCAAFSFLQECQESATFVGGKYILDRHLVYVYACLYCSMFECKSCSEAPFGALFVAYLTGKAMTIAFY